MSVPSIVEDILDAHGYSGLKKTQQQAFDAGILDGGNHLLVAKTGNGKTLCAEAVTKQTLEDGGKVAYLVPSVQLVRDKRDAIREWADDDLTVYSGQGAFRAADVAVATFESYYQAVLRDLGNARQYEYVILDDFHEIYSTYRGPGIEKTIAAILDNDINIFAMSATLGNPETLASWMDANLIVSDEGRQITIEEHPVQQEGYPSKKEQVANIVAQHRDKGPFIVFNASRGKAESRANEIAEQGVYDGLADVNFRRKLKETVDGRLTPTLEDLVDMMEAGVAYHHAGLPNTVKELIEDHFYAGDLAALCSTTTIAYGFDAPVQSTVVADLKRYNFDMGVMTYVGNWEYTQWIGRAARPGHGYDPGHAYVLTKDLDEGEQRFWGDDAELEDVMSHVESDRMFRWFLLELIELGWTEPLEIEGFMRNTLFYEQLDNNKGAWGREFEEPRQILLEKKLRETASWLERHGFINESRTHREFSPTPLGSAAVKFNFDLFTTHDLEDVARLHRWLNKQDDLTPQGLVEHVADPFRTTIAGNDSELTPAFREELDRLGYGTSDGGQTACLLFNHWCQNDDEADATEETGVDCTYLGSTASSMATLLDAIGHLFDALPDTPEPDWLDLTVRRLDEGVHGDALPFVENVSYFGRYRARMYREYLRQTKNQRGYEGRTLGAISIEMYEDITDPTLLRDYLTDNVSGVGTAVAENLIDYIAGLEGEPAPLYLPGEGPETVERGATDPAASQVSTPDTRSTSLDDFC